MSANPVGMDRQKAVGASRFSARGAGLAVVGAAAGGRGTAAADSGWQVARASRASRQ